MKATDVRDILIMAAFSGIAYLVYRNYCRKRRKDYEARDFVHFQLF